MTDKSPEERALEQAVIDAALAHTAEEKINHYSELVEACDTLRDFRAPKPKPRCEPPDADKDWLWHWLVDKDEKLVCARWKPNIKHPDGNTWIVDQQSHLSEEAARLGYIYECVATPRKPKVKLTDSAIIAWQDQYHPQTYHYNIPPSVMREIVYSALKHFSLPAPVDLPDADLDVLWNKTFDPLVHPQMPHIHWRKFARAVRAAGRGE